MIQFLKLNEDAIIPTRANRYDVGFDFYTTHEFELNSKESAHVETGIALQIPLGFAGIIKPRSGLAFKHSVDILGGVLDPGFEGEVKIALINHGKTDLKFLKGDRVAQLIVPRVELEAEEIRDFEDLEVLEGNTRGVKGFGSTGK